jgi:hypothetical protein
MLENVASGPSGACSVEGPWRVLGGGAGAISVCSTHEFLTLACNKVYHAHQKAQYDCNHVELSISISRDRKRSNKVNTNHFLGMGSGLSSP